MRYLFSLLFPVLILILSVNTDTVNKSSKSESIKIELDDKQGVNALLLQLGDTGLPHPIDFTVKGASAKAGEEIIKFGFTKDKKGKEVRKQSKHFVCTSCHNLVKEDQNLSVANSESRLQYAIENDLPYLQGTTLYGAVNRTSFYNDDYYKKYGDLVYEARNDIRKAIQLCATECAQGRELEKWEIESVLAYLYEIDLKVADLTINSIEREFIEKALNDTGDKVEAINLVKSKYLKGAPATFLDPPAKRKNLSFENPNLQSGKMIYEKSCLYCHDNGKYSNFYLDNSKLTFKHLSNKANGYGSHSIYQVIRYGVPSYVWKKSYMPHYTKEKMSDNQLNDLRAYIDFKAKD